MITYEMMEVHGAGDPIVSLKEDDEMRTIAVEISKASVAGDGPNSSLQIILLVL